MEMVMVKAFDIAVSMVLETLGLRFMRGTCRYHLLVLSSRDTPALRTFLII